MLWMAVYVRGQHKRSSSPPAESVPNSATVPVQGFSDSLLLSIALPGDAVKRRPTSKCNADYIVGMQTWIVPEYFGEHRR